MKYSWKEYFHSQCTAHFSIKLAQSLLQMTPVHMNLKKNFIVKILKLTINYSCRHIIYIELAVLIACTPLQHHFCPSYHHTLFPTGHSGKFLLCLRILLFRQLAVNLRQCKHLKFMRRDQLANNLVYKSQLASQLLRSQPGYLQEAISATKDQKDTSKCT